MKPMLDSLQKKLDEWVKQVRLTNRLTSSPVCLVGAEHDYSPQLEKLLQKGKTGGPKQRRIMELNPNHDIVAKLKQRYDQDQNDPILEDYAQLLFGAGLLAEGGEIPEPVKFNRAVADLMARAI
jgi:molecular chaperone HtpG